ncbi:MAG: ComF family protein [Solobacterium sp.]|nr:ComF family protein [Solobacterium sp.]
MRCLLCGKRTGSSSMPLVAMFSDDPLCYDCRKLWKPYTGNRDIEGMHTDILYDYRSGYSSALIQYKECGDEALKDIFLYPHIEKIRWKYRGYTLLLMPSAKDKLRQRGFDHLKEMFACLNMPMMSPFEKLREIDQKGGGRSRRTVMSGNIILKEGTVLPEKILLADDVVTTGSTLRGALKCIDTRKHRIMILCVGGV